MSQDLSQYPLDRLFEFRAELADRIVEDRGHVDTINAELARRLEPGLREALGNEAGGQRTFAIGPLSITGKIAKTVSWDSDKLRAAGEAMGPALASELLTVKLAASEKDVDKAIAFGRIAPETARLIEQAKTVKYGKAAFDLKD